MQAILCSPNSSAYILLLLYVACFVLLLTPGILASIPLLRKKQLDPAYVPLFAFGVAALCGYLFFWVFLLNHVAGKLLSFGAVIVLLIVYLDPFLRKVIVSILSSRDVFIPIVLTFVIGIFYTSVAYIGYFDSNSCAHENFFFIRDRLTPYSPDYLIQRIWVDKLFANASPWNIVLDPDMARTTVGDRPPVMGGIALIFFTWIPRALDHFYFMVITTIASTSWIAAIWVVCREAKLSAARSILLVVTLSQTFYFYFSSVFTWPKALSGSLFIGAFVLLALRPRLSSQRAPTRQFILGSVFAGLSFLTHNSTMLLLLPMGLLLLSPKLFPGIRTVILGAFTFALITFPYVAVKSINEPSVSNLTKYTLTVPESAPVEPEENKHLSTLEAVKRAYSAISFREVVDNKLHNISSIFNAGCFGKCNGISTKKSNWDSELMPIAGSMKFFNIGWFLLLLPWAMVSLQPAETSQWAVPPAANLPRLKQASAACAWVASLGLLIYALASFRQEVNNILSSGFMMLLFLAAGLRLFALHPVFIGVFLFSQAVYFHWITIQVVIEDHLKLVPAMVFVYVIFLFSLVVLPFWFLRSHGKPALHT